MFASREAFERFLDGCVQTRHATAVVANAAIAVVSRELRTVSRASSVQASKHFYSVSLRLIGHRLRVRLHADVVEGPSDSC